MPIEVRTFRLRAGADEAAFLAADKSEQTALMIRNRGMLRRTTARGDAGEWLVLTSWDSPDDVEPPSVDIAAFIGPDTERVASYDPLPG